VFAQRVPGTFRARGWQGSARLVVQCDDGEEAPLQVPAPRVVRNRFLQRQLLSTRVDSRARTCPTQALSCPRGVAHPPRPHRSRVVGSLRGGACVRETEFARRSLSLAAKTPARARFGFAPASAWSAGTVATA
jgi:hypothetical protein